MFRRFMDLVEANHQRSHELKMARAKNRKKSRGEPVREHPQSPPPPPVSDAPGALRVLKDLHDEGILNDDEYETRRQVLLSQLPTATQASAPAGWHPDPYGTARLRWWDGHSWSAHTAP